jgi:hypothetical protein
VAETETKDEFDGNKVTQASTLTEARIGDAIWEVYLEQHRKIEQERIEKDGSCFYPEAIMLGLNQQEYKGYLKGAIIDALREGPNISTLKKARNHLDTLIEMMAESSC